ncbi:MAG: serine protease [Sphingomonadaceae bacterium]
MKRLASLLALLALLIFMPAIAQAEPADIDAATRGVVRVVIIGADGDQVYPLSHGTGFAVAPDKIVTNAHVVSEAAMDDSLRIGIVPSEGNDPSFARLLAFNPRNDLALLQITGSLRLPALALAGGVERGNGEVTAIGYPANVDRAQGLRIADLLRSQPPVESRGFLSGQRPSRDFDTLLHTAPIARGNSGGPLVDGCGRVVGVNSFGSDSGGADAEFYFAVSNRELLPFLRKSDVKPVVNGMPCRSLAELDNLERARLNEERASTLAREQAATRARAEKQAEAERNAELAVMEQRENFMAIAGVLIVVALGAGLFAWQAKQRDDGQKKAITGGIIAGLALIGALVFWFNRPGMDEIDQYVADAMNDAADTSGNKKADPTVPLEGRFLCSIDTSRSRITGNSPQDLSFEWTADGCVNQRTQYGFDKGAWSRIFVPNQEDAISINTYDPQKREFRTDRYLLGRDAMTEARTERSRYNPPECGAGQQAAQSLGSSQAIVSGLLPDQPNERLIYTCRPAK